MIIIMGAKTFEKFWGSKKNRKLFCTEKHKNEPFIFDACMSTSTTLQKMTNAHSLESLAPASKYLKEDNVGIIDEKKESKHFFKSTGFTSGATIVLGTFLNGDCDMNILLVVKEKVVKVMGKKYAHELEKCVGYKAKSKKDKEKDEDDLLSLEGELRSLESNEDEKEHVVYLYDKDDNGIFTKKPSKKACKKLSKCVSKTVDKLKSMHAYSEI